MSFDRGEWETRTAERNAAEWPEDRPDPGIAVRNIQGRNLDRAQAKVDRARAALEDALAERKAVVIGARHDTADGWTIYAIAKRLGVSQQSVRAMLGL